MQNTSAQTLSEHGRKRVFRGFRFVVFLLPWQLIMKMWVTGGHGAQRFHSDMGSFGTVSNTAQWDIDLIWKCNACIRHCWTGSCRVFQEPLAPLHVASILWSILQHHDGYRGQPYWRLPGVDTWTKSHSQARVTSAQTQKLRFWALICWWLN